ncbi:MAG: hypothetical protein ABJC04_00155 [Verrucomicrobiota bacterium]
MNATGLHNGCDRLMLGFDYELRRRGFAGNSCQISIELSAPVKPALLEKKLRDVIALQPVLCSRPSRTFPGLKPYWKPTAWIPLVRVHQSTPGIFQQIFNQPLDSSRGELFRFDLVDKTVVLTWSHALMDAKSAEYFLALLGSDESFPSETSPDWFAERGMRPGSLRARIRTAWRELIRMDVFRKALPVSLATQRPPAGRELNFISATFSKEDSGQINLHANLHGGFLANSTFHLAATLLELHALHLRLQCPSASYVVPIPVGLRPKGTRAPLFSNQVAMMLHQFLPEQLDSMPHAVAAVKEHSAESLRDNALDSGIALAQLFRCFPLPVYMRLIKQQLRGEICSLFFGDVGATDPALQTFFGARIESATHIPAVTVPPGLAVAFYRFHEQLSFTVVYAKGTLNSDDAKVFVDRLRERLLHP